MRVILIPNSTSGRHNTSFSDTQVKLLGLFVLIIVPLVVSALGFWIGSKYTAQSRPKEQWVEFSQLRDLVKAQRQAIADIKNNSENHLHALGLRLGLVQAEVTRINALGKRLTTIAGLDKGEFNFKQAPGLGGPHPRTVVDEHEYRNLVDSLNHLSIQVEEKYADLMVLEAMLMDRDLYKAQYPVGWPLKGGWISSNYGYRRDPFNGRRAFHKGVDIATKPGAPIKAIAAGIVIHADFKAGFGLMVAINHGNGYITRYAHALSTLVKVGEKVDKGQYIAVVGSTGRSTGPHVHFEVLDNGRNLNPRRFLRAAR